MLINRCAAFNAASSRLQRSGPATLGLLAVLAAGQAAAAPRDESRFLTNIPWSRPNITKVVALGYSELGIEMDVAQASMTTVEGRTCVRANLVSFDVDDRYAFDVDEPIELTITYAPDAAAAPPIMVAWDKNGGDGHGRIEIKPEPGASFRTVKVTLDRARLAGLGALQTDISVGSRRSPLTLCDIVVKRSNTTAPLPPPGKLVLRVVDPARGKATPARVGVYDASGRLPMPGVQAVEVRRFADKVRRHWVNTRTLWPSQNRQAFYVSGAYEADLPAGRYELAVTRGPEYRAHRSYFDVRPGQPTEVSVSLDRFQDLPAAGWHSGESHLHLSRDQVVDDAVWAQVAAEDLKVSNLLEMGNIDGTYFKQPAWGPAGRYERDGYIMVSGQEDPRTGHRGHTILWNLKAPVHQAPGQFYSYHRVFEEARKQGALMGYAHLGELFNGSRGLALDVPFGLVDFIEVLQGSRLNTEVWYSFLNLGYRILPVAGADYPFFGPTLPGAERTYVKLDGPLTADRWFASFKSGRVYVTNGPFLDLKVNGREMGSELRVRRGTRLDVSAVASLNPDIDPFDRVEIVVLGDVAHTAAADGRTRVEVRHQLVADKSMWIAVRAYGKRQGAWDTIAAHSAPIYVVVDDQPTWKTDNVAELVQLHRTNLQALLAKPIDPVEDLEGFETGPSLIRQWEVQLPAMRRRVEAAYAKYEELLQRLARAEPR
jgi:hypothetical protein